MSLLRRLSFASLLVVAVRPAQAQQSNDAGTATVSAVVSGYVDIAAGGPAVLLGASGGRVLNNKSRGASLTGLTIQLGDLGPGNNEPFVVAKVPLRLRSNAGYVLAMSATPWPAADPYALKSDDLGFGLAELSRTDANVLSGSDTPAAGVAGNPAAHADADPATPAWDYAPAQRISSYAAATTILSGPRIMKPVPTRHPDGLTVVAYFCVKPQFYTPGAFSTTVTFTVSTP